MQLYRKKVEVDRQLYSNSLTSFLRLHITGYLSVYTSFSLMRLNSFFPDRKSREIKMKNFNLQYTQMYSIRRAALLLLPPPLRCILLDDKTVFLSSLSLHPSLSLSLSLFSLSLSFPLFSAFLNPNQSATRFLQQLGRGRKAVLLYNPL
jgi:hypothetical protein